MATVDPHFAARAIIERRTSTDTSPTNLSNDILALALAVDALSRRLTELEDRRPQLDKVSKRAAQR